MEEVLDLYEQPYNPAEPVVCFDETSKQLIQEVRLPTPAAPGQVAHQDYEYQRNGTCNLFMFFEPLTAGRHMRATEHRTCQDFAHCMQWLVEHVYPNVHCIHLVLDNLNIHAPASLYATFPPAQARRILARLRFHHTPKHGSWLNMAEIELSVLSRLALDPFESHHLALRSQPQQKAGYCQLAFYDGGCPYQAPPSLSLYIRLTEF